jgi:tRNA dimethylallyltransferase
LISESDYTDGILQTIGFKEFIPYLEKYDESHDALINDYTKSNDKTSPEPEGLKTLNECLDELKLVTKRYSKKQIKWIKNRFLGNRDRQVPPLYGLDTSDVSKWREMVYEPAERTISSYIEDLPIDLEPVQKVTRLGDGLNEETNHFCDTCNRVFIGEFQFQLHLKSNKHKVMKARSNKLKKHLNLSPTEKS